MSETWSADDRAAARAFLQRSEVRLGTLHRVATALLSGAGLMVLLPAMMRDQIAGVVGALVTIDPSAAHVVLAGIAAIVLALPLVVLFALLGDLTRFYFHAHHVEGSSGAVFVPRFTLTGLQIPGDDLSPAASAEVASARLDDSAVELVVPPNRSGRRRIDQRLSAYDLAPRDAEATDLDRAAGLFELIGTRERSLAVEVAKVEYGMTRHLLRLQVIVIRYVKALLVFLVTALAIFGAAAVVTRDERVGTAGQLWLSVIFGVWAAVATLAVSSPVRWVDDMLRAEGATAQSVAADPEFTRFERVVVAVGAGVLVLSIVVLVLTVINNARGSESVVAACGLAGSCGVFVWAARRSTVRVVSRR